MEESWLCHKDTGGRRGDLAGLGVGVARGPVLGRESYAPEGWVGQAEFHSNLSWRTGRRLQVGYDALERGLCLYIRQDEAMASLHGHRQHQERAMGTDR